MNQCTCMPLLSYVSKEFSPGSIVCINLSNFVTYDKFELFPGPHMNMIIGPNGSGKSSIVAAIALGLGFSTQILGRSTQLGHFVKKGKESATIEISLCKAPSENTVITIRREFSSNYGGGTIHSSFKCSFDRWFIDNAKSTKEAVVTLTSSFNIHLNNLCQFLPQDRLFEFSRLTSSELLVATQEAIEPQETLKMQKQLIELGAKEREFSQSIEGLEKDLVHQESLNENLLPQVQRYKENEAQLEHISLLKSKRPWLEYNEARSKFLTTKSTRDQLQKELEDALVSIEPLKDAIAQASQELKKHYDHEAETQKHYDSLESKRISLQGKFSIDMIELAQQRLSSILAKENSHKARLEEVKVELETLNKKETSAAGNSHERTLAVLGPELVQLGERKRRLQTQLDEIINQRSEIEQEGPDLQRKINNSMSRLAGSQNHFKLEMLRHSDPDTFQALEWFRKNRHLFTGRVSEPICLELEIKDQRYSSIVESALSKQAMMSFVFEEESDYELFLKTLHDSLQLRVNAIHIKRSPEDYLPLLSIDMIQSTFGFDCYLRDMVEAPGIVIAALCDQFRIHLQPVALGPVDFSIVDKQREIVKYFANGQAFEIRKLEKGTGVVISKAIRPARFFKDSFLDSTRLQAEEIVSSCREKLQQNERKIKEFVSEENQLQSSFDGAQTAYRLLLEKRQALQAEIDEAASISRVKSLRYLEMEQLKDQLSHLTFKIAESKTEQAKAYLEKAQLFKEISAIFIQIPQILSDLTTLVLNRGPLEEELKNFQTALVDAETSFATLKASFEASEIKLAEVRAEAKLLLAEAKKHPLTDEVKSKFEMFPENLEELDVAIVEAEALAALSSKVSYKIVEDWERRCVTISKLKEKISSIITEKNQTVSQLKAIETIWTANIIRMVDGIHFRFSSFFSSINCEGKVLLDRHDNNCFERWGIQILVKFRANEQLSLLDSERQSGGERSVATILYLMALQENALCPFRIVDEINQGMDPRNERLVHKLIVNAVTPSEENVSCQYFLITPKLLLDLEYAKHTKLLCIMNGPGFPSEPLLSGLMSF